MKKLSISRKILAGFFLILLVSLVFVGAAALIQKRMQSTIELLQDIQIPVMALVQEMTTQTTSAGLVAMKICRKGKDPELEANFTNFSESAKEAGAKAASKVKDMGTGKGPLPDYIESIRNDSDEMFRQTTEMIEKPFAPGSASATQFIEMVNESLEKIHQGAKLVAVHFTTSTAEKAKVGLRAMMTKMNWVFIILPLVIILFGGLFTWFISTGISGPLEKILKAMGDAEQGFLETRLNITSQDEFQKVGESFNRMLAGICQMISKVLTTSNDLATSSQQLSSASVESAATLLDISKNVNEINTSALDISTNLEKTSTSVDQFSHSAQQVAQLAETAVQAASTTVASAEQGGRTVKRSVDMVGKIKEAVDIATQVILDLNSTSIQISEIVSTIQTIASQTNLLALNAAIEAARAGEQGKGFTVVADEVRKLAEESAEAADAIGTRIENILTKTQNAVDSMQMGRGRVDEGKSIIREVSLNLDNVIQNISDVNKKIKDISKISAEQSQNSLMVSRTVEDITKLTKSTSERTSVVATSVEQQTTTVSQISSSTEDLARLADELHSLVSRFTIQTKKG